MLPCHYANTVYYGNIMNIFQRKSLKLHEKKNNQEEGRNNETPFRLIKVFSEQLF